MANKGEIEMSEANEQRSGESIESLCSGAKDDPAIEADVQGTVVILQDVKSRLAHRLANWGAMQNREMMWCMLQLTEGLEAILQRERRKRNS